MPSTVIVSDFFVQTHNDSVRMILRIFSRTRLSLNFEIGREAGAFSECKAGVEVEFTYLQLQSSPSQEFLTIGFTSHTKTKMVYHKKPTTFVAATEQKLANRHQLSKSLQQLKKPNMSWKGQIIV